MCCFGRKRSATIKDRPRTASSTADCNVRLDTPRSGQPNPSFSTESHLTDTPEQIIERVGGRLVIPYPEQDGWHEGLNWRDKRDTEDLVTPDYQRDLGADWDKEYEALAGYREPERQPSGGKKTAPADSFATLNPPGRAEGSQGVRLEATVRSLVPS
ncbi:hypothetical protein J4E85_011112 [Alternaria conjuncta]|uniref:uncharacterized protein n=1 Tax=Alternaria conjuncta TaxID=181017 RepID=UPI002220423C|nr:uncharacterized protein J4E85_011112 [Alternaria conjuncta]KAI4912178.1 hypothetical protein J4E85_011112 [Alternaria conjuncta]